MLALVFSGNATTRDGTRDVAGLRQALSEALLRGDLTEVDDLRASNGDLPGSLFLAVKERILYGLDASTTAAIECEQALQNSEPELSYYCARIRAGNARLSGHLRDAAKVELAIRDAYAGRIKDSLLNNPDVARAGSMTSLPDYNVDIPAPSASVPLHKDDYGRLMVHIMVNGEMVEAQLDTAAYTLLSGATARRVGATIVTSDFGMAHGATDHVLKQSLAMVETVNVGEATVRHFPLVVVPEGDRDIVGLDLLQSMGSIRLSKEKIVVLASGNQPAGCRAPMMIASPYWGANPHPMITVDVDGSPRLASVDTGSVFYLAGTANAQNFVTHGRGLPIKLGDLTSRSRQESYVVGRADITLAGERRVRTFPIFPSNSLHYDLLLGAPLLDDVDVMIDFRSRRMCLEQKHKP